jgi:hypothetical protein
MTTARVIRGIEETSTYGGAKERCTGVGYSAGVLYGTETRVRGGGLMKVIQ